MERLGNDARMRKIDRAACFQNRKIGEYRALQPQHSVPPRRDVRCYAVPIFCRNRNVSSNFVVLITEHLAPEAKAWLRERCTVLERSHRDSEFANDLARADGLIVRTYTRVDDAMLEHAPRLKVVARAGVGLDNIDVAACTRRGIPVVYAPDANTQAVVEYVLMLLGDAIRPRMQVREALPAEQWEALRADVPLARQLSEMTVGILGLGRIGKRVAKALTAIGARVIYNDVLEIPAELRHGAEPVSLRDLFAHSDALTIHIDNRASNRHFVSAPLLGLMKRDSILINTSRGFVLDAAALAEHLLANPEATALLDVHDPEPFGPDYPLLSVPNARLYPHLAARTRQAMSNMSWVVRDVMAVLEGREPEYRAK